MKPISFLIEHPVFRKEEFELFLKTHGFSQKKTAADALLKYYIKTKQIFSIKRGLYASVLPNQEKDNIAPDPYLIASKLAPDSVIAYHTAMMLRGKTYSLFSTFYYLTKSENKPFHYEHHFFKPIKLPKKILESNLSEESIETIRYADVPIRVTTIERTLVDCLDKINLAGGFEELWRAFEDLKLFKWDALLNYAALYDNETLNAKLGFYLSRRLEEKTLDVPDKVLHSLSEKLPKSPHYLIRSKRGHLSENSCYIKRWQLLVPKNILNNDWEPPDNEPESF